MTEAKKDSGLTIRIRLKAYDHRVIDEDAAKTAARLDLAKATAIVLKTGLSLLGINAPERM